MRRLWLIFAQAVTVALAIFFVVNTFKPQWFERISAAPGAAAPRAGQVPGIEVPTAASPSSTRTSTSPSAEPGADAAAPSSSGFAMAAKRATPAVVSITASRAPPRNAALDDPLYRFFFGDGARTQQRQQVGLGSGVIVSAQGYLLTNNHVIEGASDIEVALTDGREARATLVGTDPETDLAVLKIDLERLPVVAFGDAEVLQVGDAVLAIGNPFNVGQTVTSGIVSALGRSQLGLNTFENFIQTDAAINPGNSGGALVDAAGRLVGINTAIFSRSGGSLGIGFAIPVTTARQVMEGLIRDGTVRRGWIGVEPRELTPEIVDSLRLTVRQGVLVVGILQDGPAARGGMQPGDVVVKVGERPVTNTAQMLTAIAALAPDRDATLTVQRGTRAIDLTVGVKQRPPPARR
jgi:serine protease DegQ